MSAITNLYAPEATILQRVRERVPGFAKIANYSELTGNIAPMIDPAGFFLRPGMIVPVGDTQCRNPRITQTWECLVCVPHIRGTDQRTTSQEAGPFVTGVIRSLAGFQAVPGGDFSPLKLSAEGHSARMAQPNFDLEGRAEFPLFFETTFTLQSYPP